MPTVGAGVGLATGGEAVNVGDGAATSPVREYMSHTASSGHVAIMNIRPKSLSFRTRDLRISQIGALLSGVYTARADGDG